MSDAVTGTHPNRVPLYLGLALGFGLLAVVTLVAGTLGFINGEESVWGGAGLVTACLITVALGLYENLSVVPQALPVAPVPDRAHERNEAAILMLMDELSSLATGDLSVRATVSEEITGAIADCINYAIGALRDLVVTINASALSLDAAAKATQASVQHLARATGAQSEQVASVTTAVSNMAVSIEQVSANAERCATVVRHSVEVAYRGGDAVRRTIDGMTTIRQTIQETSKRIKQLGESSQEIGNTVEIINDIAEQTSILALNASIQASAAGESGRGFAIVADEVQRLAERAANATRQIENLVRNIQSDTSDAVFAMDKTTTDVVGGALLAENAGAALEEIQQVAGQISVLMENISESARHQAAVSASITRSMQVLMEISTQTADGTTGASLSITKLTELSAELRRAVAGFKLPAPMPAAQSLTLTPASARLVQSAGTDETADMALANADTRGAVDDRTD
jgi:twitching motility protein PilJ